MASFRLNIARIRGCPPPEKLSAALAEFGLPDSEEFGVLNHSAGEKVVWATVIRKTTQAVPRLDAAARKVTSATVDRVTVYPFAVKPDAEVLEVYAGSAAGIEQVGLFLSGSLAVPAVVETIELDIASAVRKLASNADKFQLRSIRVSDYAHNSFMSGPYAPKFLDTEHGMDFLDEYAEFVTAAGVRFAGPTGRVNVGLSTRACFTYSCNEEDQPTVQSILRKLL